MYSIRVPITRGVTYLEQFGLRIPKVQLDLVDSRFIFQRVGGKVFDPLDLSVSELGRCHGRTYRAMLKLKSNS